MNGTDTITRKTAERAETLRRREVRRWKRAGK